MSWDLSDSMRWIEVLIAATIGAVELLLMQLFDTHPSVGPLEFVYPVVAGLLLGAFGRSPVWILGPATMLCLPIGMIVSAVMGGGGLNLWPIALAFYGALAALGLAGAAVGRGIRIHWIRRRMKRDA